MNRFVFASFLFLTAICSADEPNATADKVEPQRVPLWNGRAPIGEGQFQEAEVWITVHKPDKGNGAAIGDFAPAAGTAGW